MASVLNKIVDNLEKVDPWVKNTFGIEGIGKDLAMYPDTNKLVEKYQYMDLMFKAKGLEHQVVKNKQPVSLYP